MAVDLFLKCAELPGESQKAGHKGEIDIDSFSFGVTQTGSFQSGGTGGGAGRADFADIHFMKQVDKASPKLFQFAGDGKHIPEVVFTSQKAGEKPLVYYTITLTDCIISSVQSSGAGGGDSIVESFSINYSKIQFKYVEQLANGGAGGTTQAGFNVRTGEKV